MRAHLCPLSRLAGLAFAAVALLSSTALAAHLPVDLHPGALRYYDEADVELPEALR